MARRKPDEEKFTKLTSISGSSRGIARIVIEKENGQQIEIIGDQIRHFEIIVDKFTGTI